jgi:hypothetical protein
MNPVILEEIATASFSIIRDLSRFSEVSNLGLDAECDFQVEKVKREMSSVLRSFNRKLSPAMFFKEGVYYSTRMDVTTREDVAYALKTILGTNGTFCKTYERLACNESGLCGCDGAFDQKVELRQDGQECVLTRNSICDPYYWSGRFEAYVDPYEPDAAPPFCEFGLICIHPNTGQHCPRNSSTPRVNFKDKIFPYLYSQFQATEDGDIDEWNLCRCGQLGKPMEIGKGNILKMR